MGLADTIAAYLAPLLAPYADIHDQRHLLTYAGAGLFALVLALLRPGRAAFRARHLRAFWRLLTRRSIWLHRSSILDYKLYGVSMLFLAFAASFFVVGAGFWQTAFDPLLDAALGPAPATNASTGLAVLATLIQLIAMDFGYWLGHAAMHKSDLLWEFHKVHHSAEVMTPVTEYRQHPVEFVLIPCAMGLTGGLAMTLTSHLFGTHAFALGSPGLGAILLLHLFTFQHLRHSHIRLAFTGFWGKLLHGPAHHQIHHSCDPAHHDRNMGYLLSVWDWMAGTLHVPTGREQLTLGIGAETAEHDSLRATLWGPMRKAAAHLRRRPDCHAPETVP